MYPGAHGRTAVSWIWWRSFRRSGLLLVALLAADVSVTACGSSSSTAPTAPAPAIPAATGTWKGTGTDDVEGSEFTWVLSQNAGNVTGTSSFVGVRTWFSATGPITGSVTGQTLAFSFTIDFAAPFQFCKATATGSAQLVGPTLTGSYAGVNTCQGGPFTRGQFTLTRQ